MKIKLILREARGLAALNFHQAINDRIHEITNGNRALALWVGQHLNTLEFEQPHASDHVDGAINRIPPKSDFIRSYMAFIESTLGEPGRMTTLPKYSQLAKKMMKYYKSQAFKDFLIWRLNYDQGEDYPTLMKRIEREYVPFEIEWEYDEEGLKEVIEALLASPNLIPAIKNKPLAWVKEYLVKTGAMLDQERNIEAVMSFGNPFDQHPLKWYNLNTARSDKEGEALSHCGSAGCSRSKLYSLRNGDKSLVTVTIRDDEALTEVSGVDNQIPHIGYWKYIVALVQKFNFQVELASQVHQGESHFSKIEKYINDRIE